jgi:polar amino acid transport system substrate-binding protein
MVHHGVTGEGSMKTKSHLSLVWGIVLSLLLAGCAVLGGKRNITVATDPTWAPFESIDAKSQKIVGYDIDLMDAIAVKSGIGVTYVQVAYDPMMVGVQKCQYDAAISSISPRPNQTKDILFSDPYFSIGQQITILAGNTKIKTKDDLAGKKVGAQIATAGSNEAKKIQGTNVASYTTVDAAFQDLLIGRIDAVIVDNVVAMKYMAKNQGKLMAVDDLLQKQDIVIAVCPTETDLQGKINSALAQLKSEGLFQKLSDKWLLAAGQ